VETINLLKESDDKIIYTGIKMEAFIPNSYFKTGLVEQIGTSYSVFGNFLTFHYDKDNDDRNKARQASFLYPAKFLTLPDDVYEEKTDIGKGLQKYTVFVYYHNATVFNNVDIIMDSANVEEFFKMLTAGKFDIIEYGQMANMFELCKLYNGVDFGVPASYEEVIISDYYRDPIDPSKPARFTAKSKDFYAKGITERNKVAFTSTFSALTFEDMISMLTFSDNAKRENKKEIISDTEKVTLSL
jgi:hypothetical protein